LDCHRFNTDGIDVSGHNVHVHDVDIWNQDDCIAVKDNKYSGDKISSNMTFERINASGLGLTIGSIGISTVRNITFKDSYLYESYKGIYLKFRTPKNEGSIDEDLHGIIEDILFSNITLESPEQWAIWIGPAQQAVRCVFYLI
jgi:polygalacturonase